mgnify:CR=1 FL=1
MLRKYVHDVTTFEREQTEFWGTLWELCNCIKEFREITKVTAGWQTEIKTSEGKYYRSWSTPPSRENFEALIPLDIQCGIPEFFSVSGAGLSAFWKRENYDGKKLYFQCNHRIPAGADPNLTREKLSEMVEKYLTKVPIESG